ncbi:RICIN domain-containing protein [Puia sp.]|jgi:hypothetical protein|uniref:RICIN domain-containing protein n=1 Tax=Puia sp. TaxID=2045100 RepID=UPI002F413025
MKKPITSLASLLLTLAALALTLVLTSAASAQTPTINGDFALKNVHTGKYARIKDANSANGTPIVAYSPENWKCMTWEFQSAADGSHTLKNLFSGKTLQPLHGQAKAGAPMEEQPMHREQYQQFELVAAGNNQYLIRLKGTEFYLTPADPGGAVNSAIILQPMTNGDLQHWTLVEQHPTM